jgi:galactokinase
MKISTPGRICLFGEHQDYLGLPVIAAAISLRVQISGQPREDLLVVIHMPDIDEKEEFLISETFPYTKERDYYKSTVQVLKKRGFRFSHGFLSLIHI